MSKPMEDNTRPQAEPWPDWKLERFLLGELPPEEARALQRRADSDAALAKRLRRLREAGAPDVSPRAAGRAGRGPVFAWPSFRLPGFQAWGPAFAMILILALLPLTPFSPFRAADSDGAGTESEGGERLKGLQPSLILHRKQAEGSHKLRSGESARAGDVIQIQYESAGRAQGALFSLDAEGNVTRHLPNRGERSAALKSGGPVALDFAYELDDAAGWERFYLITSDRPFALRDVEDALRRAHPADPSRADSLPLPRHLGQSQFILLKEPGT